jgi:hypothetical protein
MDYSSLVPPVHVTDRLTNCEEYIITFPDLYPFVLKTTQIAKDIFTYYFHIWGMYNWNIFAGAHRWT